MFTWLPGEKNKVTLRTSKNDIIKNTWNNRKKRARTFKGFLYVYTTPVQANKYSPRTSIIQTNKKEN